MFVCWSLLFHESCCKICYWTDLAKICKAYRLEFEVGQLLEWGVDKTKGIFFYVTEWTNLWQKNILSSPHDEIFSCLARYPKICIFADRFLNFWINILIILFQVIMAQQLFLIRLLESGMEHGPPMEQTQWLSLEDTILTILMAWMVASIYSS